MTSAPQQKLKHFEPSSLTTQEWVNISPIPQRLLEGNEGYRHRSGAITQTQSVGHEPVKQTKNTTLGFSIPKQNSLDKPKQATACESCAKLQCMIQGCRQYTDSLMRSFIPILSQVNKGKEIVIRMEQELTKRQEQSKKPDAILIESQSICILDPEDIKKRQMSGLDYQHIDLSEAMYPKDHGSNLSELQSSLKELSQCLEDTYRLCSQSARSCFENSVLVSRNPQRPPLQRMHTLSTVSNTSETENLIHSIIDTEQSSCIQGSVQKPHPSVPSIHTCRPSNDSLSAEFRRRTRSDTEIMSSMIESRAFLLESDSDGLSESVEPNNASKNLDRIYSTPHDQKPDSPFRSHLMSVLHRQPTLGSLHESIFGSMASISETFDNTQTQIIDKPLGRELTGEDSKQLLEKITDIEQERLQLITQMEEMREKNNEFWTTISELMEELDRKELHLKLLETDLNLATTEIKLASEMRQEAEELRHERDILQERHSTLEDEHRAVKESLVQLITQKAATNKALTIENQRLRQKVRKTPSTSDLPNQISVDTIDGENLTPDDEFRLQGLIMELDGGQYVHKQGFLVKQGHKVKNWRRRMFVLDTHCLSYYKTEQPLGIVPLEEISKIQACHGPSAIKPNMFEIHRQDPKEKNIRVYYLSAPSHDEMQSWVGIVQTLKHTKEQSIRASLIVDHDSSPRMSPERPLVSNTKGRSHSSACQNFVTLPMVNRNRQRMTVAEHQVTDGVRNRMFTEAGQRRLDIQIHIDTSEDEEEKDMRSPMLSSDEDGLKDNDQYPWKITKK